jgi:galactose oxidase-like protein
VNRRVLVGLTSASLLAACSGGNPPAPQSTPSPSAPAASLGTLTVTGTGCTYEGLHHPAVAGSFAVIKLVDQRGTGFNLHLWLVNAGNSYASLAAGFLASHDVLRQQAQMVASATVAPGGSLGFTTRLQAGTYALHCVPLKDGSEYGVGYTAGPIVVAAAAKGSPGATSTAPSPRGYASMGDIPGSGVLVFGGFPSPTGPQPQFIPETWTYLPRANGPWRRIATNAVPSPGDGPLICTAGCTRLLYLSAGGETWQFTVATGLWQQKTSGYGLHGMRAAFDAESGRVIAFGGDNFDEVPIRQTWAYDPAADRWIQMHPKASPPARFYNAMAYDSKLDRVLIYGGFGTHLQLLGDTWAYDFNRDSWTQVASAGGPSARGYATMAYDPIRERMVLYGGTASDKSPLDDTWTLDAKSGAWTELEQAAGPGPRAWHAMVYDMDENTIVLFGGGPSRTYDNEVWLLNSTLEVWSRGRA